MNLTLINYNGEVLIEGIQQDYIKYYYINNKEDKSNQENYGDFIEDLKVMKCNYIGDKFYSKDEK